MGTCTHSALHTAYINGKKYVVCTHCGTKWEV